MSIHLRDIKLDRLVNLVEFFAGLGEAHYEDLRNQAAKHSILSDGEYKKLAKGTFYRYMLACLEFGLIKRIGTGMYAIADGGKKLAEAKRKYGVNSNTVKDIIRDSFLRSEAVKDSFVSLFTCQKNKPLIEGDPIAYITSDLEEYRYQLYLWCSDSSQYFGESQTKAIIWGLRPLAIQLGLIDELIVPKSNVVAPDRRIILYPVSTNPSKLTPEKMQLFVFDVLNRIVNLNVFKHANDTSLVAVSDILYLLCPLLRHPVNLVREELSEWVRFNEDWLRAERVAGFVRELSYVERGRQRRFGKATENIFIRVKGYNISHLAFQMQALVSEMKSLTEVHHE